MVGPSVGCSRQQQFLGRRPLRTCQNRVEEDNIVLIDVESDNCENVVVIDIPDSLPTEIGGGSERLRKGKKDAASWTSVICLDDDDDEDMDDHFDEDCVMNEVNVNNGSSSTWKSNPPTSGNLGSCSAAKLDGCQFDQENVSPLKLSKGKRTYSGKTSAGNLFDIYDVYDSSCDDFIDCDLMEDSCGSVKEMWEKAHSKKKWDHQNGQPAQDDLNKDTYDAGKNVKTSSDCGQCEESPSVTKLAEDEGEASSIHKNKGNLDYTTHDGGEDGLLESILNSHVSYGNNDTHYTRRSNFDFAEYYSSHFSEPSSSHVQSMKEQNLKEPSSSPCQGKDTEQVKYDRERNLTRGTSSCNQSVDNDLGHGRFRSADKSSVSIDEMSKRKDSFQLDMEQVNDSNRNESVSGNNRNQQDDQINDSVQCQDSETDGNNEFLMVSDREKLKETEEYKKATEEEWASRQRTLQIQAEEAQNLRRLRKRMKAESMRILDMEKRQKQRLEEIRDNEKKDQENSNLRDIIRAEVRRDLNKLEVTCFDMASLLQGLGIPVGGGSLPPLLSQVRVAYKRALLAFHPDRASKSDMRQQVEAEEKFKLICRMKEKFLPSL